MNDLERKLEKWTLFSKGSVTACFFFSFGMMAPGWDTTRTTEATINFLTQFFSSDFVLMMIEYMYIRQKADDRASERST